MICNPEQRSITSSPVEIPQANISINAVQSGWQINVFKDENQLIERLIKDGFNIVDSIYIVNGNDFITEGEILIQKIISYTQDKESFFSTFITYRRTK